MMPKSTLLLTLFVTLLATGQQEPAASDPATAESMRATAGDFATGWAAELAGVKPDRSRMVPWLRSATAARLFLHGLPRDADRARVRLLEALAMIAARHGKTFEDGRWQSWFSAHAWYRPHPGYSIGRLSQGEREAVDLLVRALDDRRPG